MPFDCYLKIDTIPGESTDDNHKNWIEVLSFSWGVSRPSTPMGAGAAAGRATFKEFSVVKFLDRASPQLFLCCANGRVLPQVILEVTRRAGVDPDPELKVTFMRYRLWDCIVSSFRSSGVDDPSRLTQDQEDSVPLEQVSFNYGKVEITYTETPTSAPTKTGWNLKTNKAL